MNNNTLLFCIAVWALGGFGWLFSASTFWGENIQFFLAIIMAGGSFGMANFYLRLYRGIV